MRLPWILTYKLLNKYIDVINKCREIFVNKTQDYGTSWRIFRLSSITDQIYIKAKRIRSIEESGTNKVGDPILDDYFGMINYSIIALMQMDYINFDVQDINIDLEQLMHRYDSTVDSIVELTENKNHDYGEAWRDMRISSITDIILAKLLRIKQIEDSGDNLICAEGIDSNYMDIVSYSVFSCLKLSN